jgi:hypothetical protein
MEFYTSKFEKFEVNNEHVYTSIFSTMNYFSQNFKDLISSTCIFMFLFCVRVGSQLITS